MGEPYPPTAADYANDAANDASRKASEAVLHLQSIRNAMVMLAERMDRLQERVEFLERGKNETE